MLRNFLLLAAAIGIALAIVAAMINDREDTTSFAPPFHPPFKHFIAAAGCVETESENISIGVSYPEIVEEVFVRSGDTVLENQPLFRLDTRYLTKQLLAARANYFVAMAKYEKALAQPRPELVLVQQAVVAEQTANYEDYLKRFEIVEAVKNPAAISRDEYYQRLYQSLKAGFSLTKAQAELDLLQSGSWIKDLEILQAEVNHAEKEIEVIQTKINSGTILAPFNGTVLQVNVHKGELAQERALPLIIFGNMTPLHIRIEVNEAEIWRVLENAKGIATIRGNSSLQTEIDFVRILPFVIPKKSFTGDSSEKVDTRVLPIIYKISPKDLPIYPGLIMDVYLEAKPN